MRDVLRQELQGDETSKIEVLGLVHHTHPAAAELLDDAVMRDGLPDHWANIRSRDSASQRRPGSWRRLSTMVDVKSPLHSLENYSLHLHCVLRSKCVAVIATS